MKVDFDGIQAFVAIAELGGFSRAAEQLHVTQTALTRRVQKLEAYLGLRLLDRTTRFVELTVVGREFLPQAKSIVNEMTAAVGHATSQGERRAGRAEAEGRRGRGGHGSAIAPLAGVRPGPPSRHRQP